MSRKRPNKKGGSKIKLNSARKTSLNIKTSNSILMYINKNWLELAGLLISLIGLSSIWFYYHEKRLSATSGLLSSSVPASKRYISLGPSRFIIDAPNHVFLRDHDSPVISLRSENNKLFVSSEIRDNNGNLVAELRDNEWTLNKNAIFDRNYTDSTLEIRDRNGHVALQVVDFGDIINVEGIFRCKNGWATILSHTDDGGRMSFIPPGKEPEITIQQVCEYPSDQHLGSCPAVEHLSKIINHAPSGNAYRLGDSLDICSSRDNKRN